MYARPSKDVRPYTVYCNNYSKTDKFVAVYYFTHSYKTITYLSKFDMPIHYKEAIQALFSSLELFLYVYIPEQVDHHPAIGLSMSSFSSPTINPFIFKMNWTAI